MEHVSKNIFQPSCHQVTPRGLHRNSTPVVSLWGFGPWSLFISTVCRRLQSKQWVSDLIIRKPLQTPTTCAVVWSCTNKVELNCYLNLTWAAIVVLQNQYLKQRWQITGFCPARLSSVHCDCETAWQPGQQPATDGGTKFRKSSAFVVSRVQLWDLDALLPLQDVLLWVENYDIDLRQVEHPQRDRGAEGHRHGEGGRLDKHLQRHRTSQNLQEPWGALQNLCSNQFLYVSSKPANHVSLRNQQLRSVQQVVQKNESSHLWMVWFLASPVVGQGTKPSLVLSGLDQLTAGNP